MPPAVLLELRGATLDTVRVDWRNGHALAAFLPARPGEEAHALRATGVTRVEVPRTQGASKLVREVRVHSAEMARVEIVMESGDTICIECESVAVDATGG